MKIMLDLETMGLGPTAPVLAVGAVAFDENGLGQEFYQTISLESAMEFGLKPDAGTILFWLQQNIDARAELVAADTSLYEALYNFGTWLEQFEITEVWANGWKDFQWLESAIKAAGIKKPFWLFRLERDFRTVKFLLPKVEISDEAVAHKAIDDARWQARYLIKALQEAK